MDNRSKMMVFRREEEKISLVLEERELPDPAEDEVRFAVRACGICGSDIARSRGGAYHYPIVIGHEFAGVVEYDPIGKTTGMRAAVFPILPCKKCVPCRNGWYAMCEHYDYYGSRRDGGFCTRMNVKRENLIPMPYNVTDEQAAMCEPSAVALGAVKKSGGVAGKTVVVYGAGTIGMLTGFIARAYGAEKVLYSEPNEEKLEFALSRGFGALTETDAPDVYFDACGHPSALNDILNRGKAKATVVLIGNPAMDYNIPKATYSRILRRELTLMGTWNSCPADWNDVLLLISEGKLPLDQLITHRFPLSEAEAAFRAFTTEKNALKVMLVNK